VAVCIPPRYDTYDYLVFAGYISREHQDGWHRRFSSAITPRRIERIA
jgi:hypothetical protein